MGIRAVIPIVMLFVAVVIGVGYITTAMGAVEKSADVTNTTYEEAFNSTSEASIMGLNFMSFMGPLIALAAIAVVLIFLASKLGAW